MPLPALILVAALAAASVSFANDALAAAAPSESMASPSGKAGLPVFGASPALATAAAAPLATGNASPAIPVTPSPIKPKIIDVRAALSSGRPHHTADRQLLLREFPDDLVESLWLQDWQDIERAYQFGRLVDIPSDPDGTGVMLRLEGWSRIGELEDDAYRQTLLCRLAKPAAGLLYRIASRMKLIEGDAYEALEVTSLVRTWDYQLRLSDVNPNADRSRDGVPPTHVLGLAFDIARSQMTPDRQQRIEYLFDQMAMDGQLAYYKEGSNNGLAHYHVIALPSAEFALVQDYDRVAGIDSRPLDEDGKPRTLPESPCVTFGVSLEPFSSICSCELPAEMIATTTLAMASDFN